MSRLVHEPSEMSHDRDATDVLIIGAGASGAAVAWSLARAGIGVTCLEQGGWLDPTDYPHELPDWEMHRQTDFSNDPNVRGRPEDYPGPPHRTTPRRITEGSSGSLGRTQHDGFG